MAFVLSEILTQQTFRIESLSSGSADDAITNALPGAPAAIILHVEESASQSELVAAALDEMEAIAGALFPAWLPGADGIATSAGAAVAAVRALAIRHAAETAQNGSFLADLATGSVSGRAGYTRRYQPEIRALGLGRVLATSSGRPTCALVLRTPEIRDESATTALGAAAQWLFDHGRLAVWICAAAPPTDDQSPRMPMPSACPRPEAVSAPPSAERRRKRTTASGLHAHGRSGKPHPTSPAEVVLEKALADRPWAAGRSWNCTVRLGALVNPVRVDLLWAKERCIVEVDGADHRAAGKFAADRQRDVMLQLHGYAVLRFTNVQVSDDVENVLALLQQFLANSRRSRKGR